MKKLFLIIAASLILPCAYGQSTDASSGSRDFKSGYIGARGLATFSSLKLKSIDNSTLSTSAVVGYGGGGVIGVNLSKNIGLQGEVLYSALAQKYKDNSGMDHTLNVSYINIPLLFMLNTDVSNGINLNVCAGPQVGLNTGSSITKESTAEQGVDSVNAVLAVKTGDLGFAYGAGLDFMLGDALKLSIGFRGVQGLVDISDKSQNVTTNDYYILDRAHVNTYSGYAGLAICF